MQEEESSSESSYSSSITKIAVAQIAQSVGFQGSQTSALNTLTDIAIRYLQAIAKSAASSASSFNRTQCNAFDIVVSLEELGSVQGFPGCSGSLECVLDSALVVQLERFLIFTDEIPFAKPLGMRGGGGVSVREGGGGGGDGGEYSHVPRWLPVMPVVSVEEGGTGKWEDEWRWCSAVDREGGEKSERGEVEEGVRDGTRSSVNRSGGLRKRVLCRDNGKKSGKGGVEKKRVILSFKKRVTCSKKN